MCNIHNIKFNLLKGGVDSIDKLLHLYLDEGRNQTARASSSLAQSVQVVHGHHYHYYHDQRTMLVDDYRKYVDKRKQAIKIAGAPNANIGLSGAFQGGFSLNLVNLHVACVANYKIDHYL